MKLTQLFTEFFESEKSGGLILLFATILSLVLANTSFQNVYINFWNTDVGGHTLVHLINDGLMTLFFLLIGLELEREIYVGELSDFKKASLPIFGALGGMMIPFAIFMMFNYGSDTRAGAGIPMATDIAFAIGILSLLGSRVPASLKVFLTALAVIDDLGAIIIIAIFYTSTLVLLNLFISLFIFFLLLVLNRLKVRNLIPYLVGGVAMWYFMLNSGVHATITGVLLAFVVPFGDGGERSPSYILQHYLHKPVAFFILPVFALANTCIALSSDSLVNIGESLSVGIITGLVIGKPLGILLLSFAAVRLKISLLPSGINWKSIFGAGILGGIGFTMSIFITLMAFDQAKYVDISKIAVLVASTVAGLVGYMWLRFTLSMGNADDE